MFSNAVPSSLSHSVRLIFEYEGDRVHLVSQQLVDIAVNSPDSTEINQQFQPGYYVDTRDATNQTLARIAVHNAFETSVEVFPERHDEPITRIETTLPKGAFTVVVPATDTANHVTLTRVNRGQPNLLPNRSSFRSDESVASEVDDLASFPLESFVGN
jgi:hypothetical protein